MITANVDMAGFSTGIAGLQRALGISVRSILEKEAGELVKTLVRISPPKDRTKTKDSIKKGVKFTFDTVGKESGFADFDSPVGNTGIKWYASNSKFLFGGAPDNDMRSASVPDLLRVHYSTRVVNKHQRLLFPFKDRSTSQRVALIQKIITSRKQVTAVVSKLQKHIGRLKAGWLVGISKGLIRISGAYQPPQWVARHASGARGNCAADFGNPATPSITISNTAKGIRGSASIYWVEQSLKIRSKAMAEKLKRILEGKANNYLAEYARH